MADFSLPTLVTQYADFLTQMKQRDEDIIKMLDSTTSTNLPVGSKRWNSTGNKWEKYDGTAWSNLSALYEITVRNSDKLNGQSASYYAIATHTHTDYATATHTHTDYAASTHTHDTLYPSKTGTGASGNWAINITGSSASCTGNAATATDASKLNGVASATTATANTIVKRDAAGYIYNGPINTNIGDTTTAASHYFVETESDGFIRPKTLANVKAEIAGDKAPLASPALTGTPTAPTAAVGTNTTQLATTAFVLANSSIPFSGGTYKQVPTTSNNNWNNTSNQVKITWISPKNGVITTAMTLSKPNWNPNVYGRIYINNVAVGTARSITGDTLNATFTENITVKSGDKVQVYAYLTQPTGYTGSVSLNIYSNVESLTNWVQE